MRGPAQHLWQVRAAPGVCSAAGAVSCSSSSAGLGLAPEHRRDGLPEPPQSSLMGGLEARWENSTQKKKKEELGGKP